MRKGKDVGTWIWAVLMVCFTLWGWCARPAPVPVEIRTVQVEPGESLWSVYRRATGGRLNWTAWRLRAQGLNSMSSTVICPGESLRVVGVKGN